jgi:uncharacterized protein (TIGR02285 family)
MLPLCYKRINKRQAMQTFRFILLGAVLGALFLRGDVIAQEKETIVWLTWKQVPNFISEGKFKGQGVADIFTKTLQLNLPQYNHVNVTSNTRRYQSLIREEKVCVAWAWIVPSSETFRIYSRPVSLAHRGGIQTLKSKQHLFGKPGEVLSLEKLLANPDIKLGYLEEMTYSKRVHELLEQYREEGNIYFSSTSAVEFNLNMLSTNRLDYVFGFPTQASYEAELKGMPNQYQFYNLEEIDKYTSMHSHCSNTPFGKKVMHEVDKILTNEVLMEHLAVIERWNGKNKQYRDIFMEYIIHQQPNARVVNPGQ